MAREKGVGPTFDKPEEGSIPHEPLPSLPSISSLGQRVAQWLPTSLDSPVPQWEVECEESGPGSSLPVSLFVRHTFIDCAPLAPTRARAASDPPVPRLLLDEDVSLESPSSPPPPGDKNPAAAGRQHEPVATSRERGRRRRKEPQVDSQVTAQLRQEPEHAWELACRDRESSLMVQGAFRSLANEMRAPDLFPEAEESMLTLLQGLRGHVLEAAFHPTANFVLQRVLEVVPLHLAGFVADEAVGRSVELAKGRISCRAVIGVLRHQLPHGSAAHIAAEVLAEGEGLCWHQYGNYVLQELVVCGSLEQQRAILRSLRSAGGIVRCATSNHPSRILEIAVAHCLLEDVDLISQELAGHGGQLQKSKFGRHVTRALNTRYSTQTR